MHITIKISIILVVIAAVGLLYSFITYYYSSENSSVDWECEEKVKEHTVVLNQALDLAYENPITFVSSLMPAKSKLLSEYIYLHGCYYQGSIFPSTGNEYYEIRSEIEGVVRYSDYYDYTMFYHDSFPLLNGCVASHPYMWSDGQCWNGPESESDYAVDYPPFTIDDELPPFDINDYIDDGCFSIESPFLWSDGVCRASLEP